MPDDNNPEIKWVKTQNNTWVVFATFENFCMRVEVDEEGTMIFSLKIPKYAVPTLTALMILARDGKFHPPVPEYIELLAKAQSHVAKPSGLWDRINEFIKKEKYDGMC